MIAEDFPRCPTWLNEGFAALLEGERYVDGRLIPRVNWRMRWLKALVHGVSLKRLMRTTRAQLYGKDVGSTTPPPGTSSSGCTRRAT